MNLAAAVLASLLSASPAGASDNVSNVTDACANEIELLCPGAHDYAAVTCLRDHDDDVMAPCRQALKTLGEIEQAQRDAAAAALPPPPPPPREARLVGALGSVFVRLAGRPGDQYVQISSGAPFEAGDTIRVGAGSSAEVALDGQTLIVLSSATELSLNSLTRALTALKLSGGSLSALVQHVSPVDSFTIQTPVVLANVHGSELIVSQDAALGPSFVGIVEDGRVEVTSAGQSCALIPGQETSASAGWPPQPPHVLATLRGRADAFAALRARAAQIAGNWKPMAEGDKHAAREHLAALAPIAAGQIPGFAPARPAGVTPKRPARGRRGQDAPAPAH